MDGRGARCYAFFAENREATSADLIPWTFGPGQDSQKGPALNFAAEFSSLDWAVETEQKSARKTKGKTSRPMAQATRCRLLSARRRWCHAAKISKMQPAAYVPGSGTPTGAGASEALATRKPRFTISVVGP